MNFRKKRWNVFFLGGEWVSVVERSKLDGRIKWFSKVWTSGKKDEMSFFGGGELVSVVERSKLDGRIKWFSKVWTSGKKDEMSFGGGVGVGCWEM